jgi:hypothetical protein
MSRHRQSPTCHRHETSSERLSKRLDEAAEREGHYSNAERIRRMREAMFADVDALQKSGRIKLPK